MRALFAFGLVIWIAAAGIRWWSSMPLGHDEARYALSARDLVHDRSIRWIYVPPAMIAIAAVGLELGGSERDLRVLPLLLGVGFALSAWRLARRIGGGTTAAWVVAVLAGTRPLARFGADLLSDLPSTACLLLALELALSELPRTDGPRRRLVLMAPLLAAAFYLRYGSCVPILLIGVAADALALPGIGRRPWPAIATIALFGVLFAPHLVHSTHALGSPFAILHASASTPDPATGLGTYLRSPMRMFGTLAALLAVVAVLRTPRHKLVVVLQLLAVADIVWLGLVTAAQARYVAFATVLLVILGVDAVVRTVGLLSPRWRTAVAAGCAAAVAATWIGVLGVAFHARSARSDGIAATLQAAAAIRADAAGAACQVLGRHGTQLEWYGGCRSTYLLEPGVAAYAVRDDTGGPNQPDLAALKGRIVLRGRATVVALPGAP